MSGKIYIAARSAVFEYGGKRVHVQKGRTTVREGHPLLKEFSGLFEEMHVDYEVAEQPPAPAPPAARVEEATSDPARPRTRSYTEPPKQKPKPKVEGPRYGKGVGPVTEGDKES